MYKFCGIYNDNGIDKTIISDIKYMKFLTSDI